MNIQRDSFASYIGHYPMLAYFAIAENESIGRERYNFMQVSHFFDMSIYAFCVPLVIVYLLVVCFKRVCGWVSIGKLWSYLCKIKSSCEVGFCCLLNNGLFLCHVM